MKIKEYFSIKELVDENVYNRYGEGAWKFFDDKLLECLLIIREHFGNPITINNWAFGSRFSQRGLRHNQSPMVRNKKSIYLSAHMMGKAFDFNIEGVTPNEVREWIRTHPDRFPCKVRLERNLKGSPINWVHLDVYQDAKNPKVYLFDV